MPDPYEVLNARVKQKINTEAQWIAEESDFGVIFEGEQAFVYDTDGNPVNFKIGDGTKTFSQLPYFIVYYTGVTSQKILSYLLQTDNITIASTFRNNSLLVDIIMINNSGASFDMSIGTTNGGIEIGKVKVPIGASTIGRKYEFTDVETAYFTGLTGKDFSMFILYFQLDEAPAIPPTGGGSTSFKFPKYFRGMLDVTAAQAATLFDFSTGLGIAGTGYDNCALQGTNGTQSLDGKYLIGYTTGDTIGGGKGNAGNTLVITMDNLPAQGIGMFDSGVNTTAGATPDATEKVSRARSHSTDQLNYEIVKSVGSGIFVGQTENLGIATPINIQPDSIVTLYFVAIS